MIFGDTVISVAELFDILREKVPALAGGDSNKAYTRGVKSALAGIAERYGLRLFCTDHDRNIKEFLLDFVMWKDIPRGQRAVLAVESEWGNPRQKSRKSRWSGHG